MTVLKSRRTGIDLRDHPMLPPLATSKKWAQRLREVPDETIREILNSKDVGSGRAKIAGMLVILEQAERTTPK